MCIFEHWADRNLPSWRYYFIRCPIPFFQGMDPSSSLLLFSWSSCENQNYQHHCKLLCYDLRQTNISTNKKCVTASSFSHNKILIPSWMESEWVKPFRKTNNNQTCCLVKSSACGGDWMKKSWANEAPQFAFIITGSSSSSWQYSQQQQQE